MNISLHIDAPDAESLAYILTGLAKNVGNVPAPAAGLAGEAKGEAAPVAEAPAPKTTKPRSATKKELEEQRASVETTAKADAAARADGKNTDGTERRETEAKDEPPAITLEEVRNQIIDLLNDWSAAKPEDPDVRTVVLGKLLPQLDATKISTIDPAKFKLVPALVDESRAELAAYKGSAASAED